MFYSKRSQVKIQKGRVCISPWTLIINWLEEGVSYTNLMSGLAVTLWNTGSLSNLAKLLYRVCISSWTLLIKWLEEGVWLGCIVMGYRFTVKTCKTIMRIINIHITVEYLL